ncbi:phage head closure protein [Peribacillus butanolivorans]|uniref:phage head closure protein n=1 Tax=Peribacillus butanolivorans TaxID=421767 RepID=UPI002E211A8B|nr:phage head closure protein [Peribacillus butanolivorans]MED3691302.1 phage head closure protein [Peribacillus butanolivorans]
MSEFPHIVTIEKEDNIPDGVGGDYLGWIPFRIATDALVIPTTEGHKVFMEYDEEIDSTMRVIHGEKKLRINDVIDQGGQNEVLLVLCEK